MKVFLVVGVLLGLGMFAVYRSSMNSSKVVDSEKTTDRSVGPRDPETDPPNATGSVEDSASTEEGSTRPAPDPPSSEDPSEEDPPSPTPLESAPPLQPGESLSSLGWPIQLPSCRVDTDRAAQIFSGSIASPRLRKAPGPSSPLWGIAACEQGRFSLMTARLLDPTQEISERKVKTDSELALGWYLVAAAGGKKTEALDALNRLARDERDAAFSGRVRTLIDQIQKK